ncbi:hypothetical protein [Candidatus Lokiarchaeum ossiferum]|uniref:hypothetical protein n=1 Tax=Candidatus Lokiarchaeum ossiferum TaxID=2951803 RepID=UPI00352EED9A
MEAGEQNGAISVDVKSDYKLSFSLFRENFRPFFIVLLIGFIVFKGIDHLLTRFVLPLILSNWFFVDPATIIFFFFLPGDSIFFGFFGAAMGLGYDIMSSGDGFTEVRNSLFYIRKYWLKFFFFCFFFNIFTYWLLYLSFFTIPLHISIVFHGLSLIWVILFSNIFPALVHRDHFLPAFKDNFQILSQQFGRVIITYLPYYLIFVYFRSGINIYRNFFVLDTTDLYAFLSITTSILEILYVFVGFPIFAFLSLSMYNEIITSQQMEK